MAASHAGGSATGAVANADSQNILNLTGGWDNGVYSRLIPPTVDELYCGYGNFFFPPNTTRFNVRTVIRGGPELYRTTGAKFIIANLSNSVSGDRAMAISAERDPGGSPSPYRYSQWTHASRNTGSVDVLPDEFPMPGPFHFAASDVPKENGNYAGEWVCYEYEAIVGQSVSVHIHTQDGRIAYGPSNPFCLSNYPVPVGSTFVNFGLGWYWGPGQGSFPGLYLDIGDVVISDQYIGPPAGFLTQGYTPMGFPADDVKSAFDTYRAAKSLNIAIKNDLRAIAAAASINRYTVIVYQQNTVDRITAIDTLVAGANTNGVTAAARFGENKPALDLEAEWTVTKAALVTFLNWVVNNVPIATVSIYSGWGANLAPAHINLTAGQLTAYKTQASNALATIS